MTTATMLFGPLNHMLPIPYPQSGMGWDHARDIEETVLVSGGRHVYRAPTPYRKYKLSYVGGTPGLQNLVDIHSGVYGPGPFYLLDLNYRAGNMLPTRWASAYMLRHIVSNWCAPLESASAPALAGKQVTFTNLGQFPSTGISEILATVPGQPLYLHLWGVRTGTAAVNVYLRNASTGVWGAPVVCVPGSSPSEVTIINTTDGTANTYSAVKLELYCPSGSNLTLDHINLSTITGEATRKPGLGVGAVQFVTDLSGNVVTTAFDQIGLSIDLAEVE